jgi:hypothetical protein
MAEQKNKVSFRVMGKALGVSAARVTALAKQGMPMDNIEEARRWREENAKYVPKASGEASLVLTSVDLASVDVNDPAYSDEYSLKRALVAEKQAGELLEKAVASGSPGLIRQAIQIQGEAQKTRTAQKAAYLDLQERENTLVKAEWVITRDKQLFDSINKMLDQLPAELAARVETLDPVKTKGQATELVNSLKSKIVERLEKERDLA